MIRQMWSVKSIALDGTGLGTDGAVWGGEVLVAHLAHFSRACHLRYVPLPGADQAVREPWRMAATYLQLVFGENWTDLPLDFSHSVPKSSWHLLQQVIARGTHTRPTSSAGRLFDAVAALVAGRMTVDYEAQAAIELEEMARPDAEPYSLAGAAAARTGIIDSFPLIRAVVADLLRKEDKGVIAGRFHRTLAQMFAGAAADIADARNIPRVVAAGGVMQNRLFTGALESALLARGYQLEVNREIPANDGGLSYGQAVVAQARLARKVWQDQQRREEPQPCV